MTKPESYNCHSERSEESPTDVGGSETGLEILRRFAPQDDRERIESAEKPLTGKVFLLTGASRGIGAVTAVELARRGATVIGPHREDTPKKNARANATIAEVELVGGKMISSVVDMTKFEDRQGLIQQIKKEFGQIDGIIYNHAGGMEAELVAENPDYPDLVNAYSKLFFFQETAEAGILKDEIVMIDQPSNWSKFFYSGIKQMKDYAPVAESKKLGEQLLRKATREYNEINQAKGKKVKWGMICGHAIDKTATVQMLKMVDRETFMEAVTTAKDGILPSKLDMAAAVVNMARGNFRNEDTVFVGSPQIIEAEMPEALPMYSPETRYIRNLLVLDPKRAIGFYPVQEKDTRTHFRFFEDILINTDTGNGKLDVTGNHTIGHFIPEFGLSIFPGHKIVAAAAEVATLNTENNSADFIFPKLKRIKGIEFKIPVFPGDRLKFVQKGTDFSVKIGNTEVAAISGLELEPRNFEDPRNMTPDRLIEAGAQTLGAAYTRNRNTNRILPLFGKVGPIEYYREVFPGELLEMEAVLTGEGKKKFQGDVTFRVDDEIVAKAFGYACQLRAREIIEEGIRIARRTLK